MTTSAYKSTQLRVPAPLDPEFQPPALFHRDYLAKAKKSAAAVPIVIGLEREGGLLSRYETLADPRAAETRCYVERIIKFLLWARGGWKIHFGGPKEIGEQIRRAYSNTGERAFDVELMTRVYERPFEVALMNAEAVPDEKEMNASLGGHLDGCRIGFDLGASDYKVSAVKNGEVVYTNEFPWNPKDQADPNYHYTHLNDGLRKAAAQLPRVDAIGGSSAGVIVDNQIKVASLFRAVPAERFAEAKNIFLRLREEWKVPVEVANDGDVTALAGAMSLKVNGLLGMAMGSSQAAGYINPSGCMTGWLNELAFAPADYNPDAAVDEWSGDRGVGVLYFSQQAVNKLLPAAKIQLPAELSLPERLVEIQRLIAKGDQRVVGIYETIGVYLGYTIALYREFYEFEHMLVLGRVTTGAGGDVALAKAREVLDTEFPESADSIKLHVPDEKSRRIGQAVAAASLPVIGK
ncbi:MAG TPA: ROK family protein [Verrucomicrobiae bacterium]|nr:ROK family protein [Verrucomicrobiae bacterium]